MFSILLFDQIYPRKQQTTDPKYSIYNDLIGKICPLDDNVHKILKVAGTCDSLYRKQLNQLEPTNFLYTKHNLIQDPTSAVLTNYPNC
jgi:hypothetical protein